MDDRLSNIDVDLRRIRLEIEQLGQLVGMLADEPAQVRDVWHWQWSSVMERVVTLHSRYAAGEMSRPQSEEFLKISSMLARDHELVEALGCEIPVEIGLSAEPGA